MKAIKNITLKSMVCASLLLMSLLLLSSQHAIAASPAAAATQITPSHVYQQSSKIITEIELLRSHLGVNKIARKPDVQIRKKPIHVYAKSLEVMEKIIRLQDKHGLNIPQLAQIPLRQVRPAEVFASNQNILAEIGRLKSKLGISRSAALPAFTGGKTPSQVYENMWTASYLLNGLTGQLDPSYVFRNSRLVLSEIRQIANKLGISSNAAPPGPVAGKTPKDVNIQAFKNLYAIGRLQRKLKIPAMHVPAFPQGKILSSDVYDTTNNMLAELVRIKVALGITTPRTPIRLISGKTPPDVLAQMQLINSNLNAIIVN